MILLNVLKAAKDRTVSSDKYQWSCFGDKAHVMDFKDADNTVYANAVFDLETQEVYYINVEVPGYPQAFLWLNPDYKISYYQECKSRNVDPDIAWDNVNFIHVDTEDLILEYVLDIGDGYYDNLPLPPDQIPTLEDEVKSQPITMPMPGTIGGPTLVFSKEKNMNLFKVKLDVQMVFDVEAESMDDAVAKARKWQDTSKTQHGEGSEIYWLDHYIIKEHVERETYE
jgi:hypothetical protein